MKLLHVTDLHFQKAQFEWVAKQAVKYDVVCITGDLCNLFARESIEDQIHEIKNWFASLPKDTQYLVCSGNHDVNITASDEVTWMDEIASPNVSIDGQSTQIEGFSFRCIGWGEVISQELVQSDDIILNHTPPSECDCSLQQNGEDWGDPTFGALIEYQLIPAKWILCGHAHQPLKTQCQLGAATVSNPGFSKGETPAYNTFEFTKTICIT